MLPNSSLKRIYRFPSGKRARATRAVSSGMGGRAWGCNDIGLLLLVGSLVILTLFRLFYHLLLLPLLPFANRVFFCKESLFGSDSERSPPRMSGSRAARTGSGFCQRGSRWVPRMRGGLHPKQERRRLAPQKKFQEESHRLFTACFGGPFAKPLTALLPLPTCGLPGLLPALIANRIA